MEILHGEGMFEWAPQSLSLYTLYLPCKLVLLLHYVIHEKKPTFSCFFTALYLSHEETRSSCFVSRVFSVPCRLTKGMVWFGLALPQYCATESECKQYLCGHYTQYGVPFLSTFAHFENSEATIII